MSYHVDMPMRELDFMAGAQALYASYHVQMGIPIGRYKAWSRLPASVQDKWVKMLKAGFKMARDTQMEKGRGEAIPRQISTKS